MNRKLKIHWRGGLLGELLAMAPLAHAEEIGSVDTAFSGWGRTTRSSSRLSTIQDRRRDLLRQPLPGGRHQGRAGAGRGHLRRLAGTDKPGRSRSREKFKDGEEVFTERRSLLFKKNAVVRFLDEALNIWFI
ncbi:MAG: CreA family protein [Candidatus Competibacteraceae bacterium]